MENSTKSKEVQESHELMKKHMENRAEKRRLLAENPAPEDGGEQQEHVMHHPV